jgi:L-rhamnose mutarotase
MMSKNFKTAMQKLGEKEIFKRWIEKMDQLMDEIQDYSGKGNIITLENVFNLEKQLDDI